MPLGGMPDMMIRLILAHCAGTMCVCWRTGCVCVCECVLGNSKAGVGVGVMTEVSNEFKFKSKELS